MKLPVKQILKRNKYKIVDKEGFEVVYDVERLCDAMLIEDSLNNYPKAIDLLTACRNYMNFIPNNIAGIEHYTLITEVNEFLKQIEN